MTYNTNIELDDILETVDGLSPSTYQYYNGLQKGRIIFNDVITSNVIETVVLPLLDMDEDDSIKHIEFIFNSEGGEVYAGMTLCSVIERLKTPTTIRILSIAASMGALVAMAGANNPNVTVECYPFTVFLIHSGEAYFGGSANLVKDAFQFQEKYEAKISDYILSHTHISKKMYEARTRYEWWFDANSAKEYGIVDKIL